MYVAFNGVRVKIYASTIDGLKRQMRETLINLRGY